MSDHELPTRIVAVSDEGKEVLPVLLAPFFEALLPAFADRAAEIRIEPTESTLKLTYKNKSVSMPLHSLEPRYIQIVYTRILILSGMSIATEAVEQTGAFEVCYGRQRMTVHVATKRNGADWYLIFQPSWD